MLKEPFESQDFVSFDTQYGDKIINLDIPRDNFDTDKCTVWLSLQDIGDLCNANIPFIKSSRLMNSGIFDSNEDIMRYQEKTGEKRTDSGEAVRFCVTAGPARRPRSFS